jgi:hypothetical protein
MVLPLKSNTPIMPLATRQLKGRLLNTSSTKKVLLVGVIFVAGMIFNLNTIVPAVGDQQFKLDAIVTVAMCGFNANEMVESVRKAGEWKGPIYVITDTPDAENKELCTPVDVRGHHPDFLNQEEFEAYKKGIERLNPSLYSKWHKTQIFQLLPKTINTALFIDADMMARQPLAKSWLPSLAKIIGDPNCDYGAYHERFYTKLPIISQGERKNVGKVFGGMSLQKRKESAPLMKEWSRLMTHAPFLNRDQGKLTQSIEATEPNICWLPSHWLHLHNQADQMDRIWFKLIGEATFLHLASAKKGEWKERSNVQCDFSNLPEKAPTPKDL